MALGIRFDLNYNVVKSGLATLREVGMLTLHAMQDMMATMLARLYNADRRLLSTVDLMMKSTDDPALREVLDEQHRHTQRRRRALERLLGDNAGESTVTNPAVEAVARKVHRKLQNPATCDALGLATELADDAARLHELQLAAYTTAIELARASGDEQVARLLERTVYLEHHLDDKLRGVQHALHANWCEISA